MRDPIDELESFSTPGLPMNPLPASEVRRRGTRMRRRNTTLATIGTVAAVAVIATPIAMAANGTRSDGSNPPVASQSPKVSWVSEIPANFPLTDGMPAGTESTDGYEPSVTEICGPTPWNPDNASALRQATYTDASEGGRDRTLALFSDGSEAAQTMTTLAERIDDCADSTSGRTSGWAEVLSTPELGEQTVVYANHYTDGGDVDVVQVLRVGNAILQDTAYTLGGGDPQVVQSLADNLGEKSSNVVAAMCTFSAEGCGDTDAQSSVVPDDFPLQDGYPAAGETAGPTRDLAPLVLDGCDGTVEVPEHTDLLRSGFHGEGEDRERQLVTFADEQQAQAYLESVIAVNANCPEDEVDGRRQLVQSIDSVSGYDAAGHTHIHWEQDGEPMPGIETITVIREGASVLLSTIASDEGVGPNGGRIQEQTATSFSQLDGVVDAMADLP